MWSFTARMEPPATGHGAVFCYADEATTIASPWIATGAPSIDEDYGRGVQHAMGG